MDRKLYPVRIALGGTEKTYSPEFQTNAEYVENWKRVLLMAHGKSVVRCCCAGTGEKLLSIHSRSGADRLHLARFPDTGPEHADDCVFYSADPNMSGLAGYRLGVIQELDDGNVKVKLKVGLQQKPTAAPDDAASAANAKKPATPLRQARTSQASMTLLGLLHYLWTQAGFNTWKPGMQGKRTLGVLHHYLLNAAAATYAGRVRLSSNLLIATQTPGRQAGLNQAKAMEAMSRRQRLIVIAPLARHSEDADKSRMPIAGFHGIPHLNTSPEVWDVLQHRFPSEMNGWMSGTPVIAIMQTDAPTPAGGAMRAKVIDAALMLTTPQWIPVDSGYEAAVAASLVNDGRAFEKPLCFDSNDRTFPDFWLRDLGDVPVPMEVWGMSSPDYLVRKAEKTAYYDEKYGPTGWWQWDAASGSPMPSFPKHV